MKLEPHATWDKIILCESKPSDSLYPQITQRLYTGIYATFISWICKWDTGRLGMEIQEGLGRACRKCHFFPSHTYMLATLFTSRFVAWLLQMQNAPWWNMEESAVELVWPWSRLPGQQVYSWSQRLMCNKVIPSLIISCSIRRRKYLHSICKFFLQFLDSSLL